MERWLDWNVFAELLDAGRCGRIDRLHGSWAAGLLATTVFAAAARFRSCRGGAIASLILGAARCFRARGGTGVGQCCLAGDFESHVLDHPIIFRGGLALGGQVIADEDAIGDVEPERLQGSEVAFATSSDPKFALGVHETEHRESAEAVARGEVFLLLHRRPIDRMQEVERDGFHVKFSKRESHFNDVALAFPHPDDTTTAELQSCFANVLECFHSIVKGMGRANLFVVFAARVEVVVDFIDASCGQPHRLGFIEEPKARANVQAVLLLDFGNNGLDGLDLPFVGCATADNDAISFALSFRSDSCSIEEFVPAEDGVLRDRCIRDFRLAAVVAVLWAESAFCVHQEVELDRLSEMLMADTEGR